MRERLAKWGVDESFSERFNSRMLLTRWRCASVWRGLVVSILSGCGGQAAPDPPGGAGLCEYDVLAPERGERFVDVSVRCSGARVARFAPADRALAEFVSSGNERASPGLPAALDSGRAVLSYRVDLRRMAEEYDSIDIAAQ